MSALVVFDTSTAISLVLDEELSDQADALFQASAKANTRVVAPPLLFAEVANALYQRTRRTTPTAITEEVARDALERFLGLAIFPVEPQGVYTAAFAFARTHALPRVYDCLYVVTAQLLGVELWTADRALINSLGSAAPWVRFIGDYPLPAPTAPLGSPEN